MEQLRDPGAPRNSRVVIVLLFWALGLAAMALAAYAFGRVTRTDWVWWLAPLTVAVDGCLLLRVGLSDGGSVLSPLGPPIFVDLQAPTYLSCVATAAMAAGGAYTGSRVAVVTGIALAMLGNALDRSEERRRTICRNPGVPQRMGGSRS